MLTSQEEQIERRRVMAQDASLREQSERRVFAQDQSLPNQSSTFYQHAIADADTPRGRFSAVNASTVVGSTANPAASYPACSPALAVRLPDEPPLPPNDNPALEVSFPSPQATDPTSDDAPSSIPLADVQRTGVGSLSQSGDPAGVIAHSPPVTSSDVQAGSPPSRPHRRY